MFRIRFEGSSQLLLINNNNKNFPGPNVSDLELQNWALVELNPSMSSQEIACEFDIEAATVQRIVRKNKYRAYKISTQELFPYDYYPRMEFCETMINKYHMVIVNYFLIIFYLWTNNCFMYMGIIIV